ncbi:MAG: thioredoxin [Hyphomicrobiales bacterium]
MDPQILNAGGGPAEARDGELIKDTTTRDFVKDVMEASKSAIVLVDFWAPWCGPCKQLTPILEAAVKAAKGRVRLVKMNIDEHPAIPGQMGVQSIPAVFAFKDGRPVDGFMGALPESQIKAFIDRVAGPAEDDGGLEEALAAAAEALEAGDTATAAALYAQVLQEDASNPDAIGGLARCYIRSGDLEHAEQTLALAPPAKAGAEPIAAARAMLELAKKGGSAEDLEALRAKVAADPKDHQARFDLALALNAAGDRAGAAEELLSIVARDRKWNEDGARKQLVQLFEAWGPGDPHTVEGRQRLSVLLFS